MDKRAADQLERTVRETILREKLLRPGDGVIVGFSGGADSCALLQVLLALRREFSLTLGACHVNHLLRGEEAWEDEKAVVQMCRSWGVPLWRFRRDIPALSRRQGMGEEECGRKERYACFSLAAQALKTGEWQPEEGESPREGTLPPCPRVWIATAHNRDDSIETLLFHLCRGSGLTGLCGIPYRRGEVIRPLLDCPRQLVEVYCREKGVSWREDSTNRQFQYSRNRIRGQVFPLLEQVHPGAREHLAQTQRILRQEEDYLSIQAKQVLDTCRVGEGLMVFPLYGVHPALRRRALRLWLLEQGGDAGFPLVERVEALAMAGQGSLTWERGRQIICREGMLQIALFSPQAPFSLPLTPGEWELPWGDRLVFQVGQEKSGENFGKIFPKGFFFLIDYDKIRGNLIARSRQPGDRFSQAGRGVTKTLKKLFNEAKIAPYNRNKIPVLADDEGILAVMGFGVSQRAAVTCQTTCVGSIGWIRDAGKV